MEAKKLEPGTILAGKYQLESRLGEGGMGTVYRAQHLALRAPVAVKVIDREVVEGDLAHSRFIREAQAAASLRSPHVVQILDYGMEGERPFMVMELLEGETLAERLDRLHRLSPVDTYRVVSHIARAVAKAHEAGIVHRDLKPDNVFLVENEGDEVAKVLDFGVAKVDATSLGGTHTRTGSLLGTPYYMSPEQAQGNKEIDHRSDLWALGVIAFECLLGERPFSSDGLGDLVIQICIRDIVVPSSVGTVPPGFDEWFRKAVAREPEHRFQSARELSEALREALGLARDPLASAPESLWSVGPRPSRKEPNPAAPALLIEAPPPPDFVRTTDESPRGEELSERGARRPRLESETEETPPTSWRVIPHADTERGDQLSPLAPATRTQLSPEANARSPLAASDSMTLPPTKRVRPATVLLIVLSALAIGALVVLALEEAGIPIPGLVAERAAKKKPSEGAATKKPKAAPTSTPAKGKPAASTTPPAPGGSTKGALPRSSLEPKPATSSEVAPLPSASQAPALSVEIPDDPSPNVPVELEPTPSPPPPVATEER